jgi:hypothetical protein
MMCSRARTSAMHRRAFAVASAVVLLLMLNVLAFGTIDGARDDGGTAALRVQTLRALYAAESGVQIAVGELNAGRESPAPGTIINLDDALVEFQPASDPDAITIEGRAGLGRRRLVVEMEGNS